LYSIGMSWKGAEVNGEQLNGSELRERALALRREREASGQMLDLEQRMTLQEEALELVIDRMLLVQEARRLGLEPHEAEVTRTLQQIAPRFDGVAGCRAAADTQESRADISRRMMVDRILERWRSPVVAPRGEEVRSYYRRNKEQFYVPELIHASHFVRAFAADRPAEATREVVEESRSRVLNQEDFAEVAARYSDCPEKGGDLGWFGRGSMVEEFELAVFNSPLHALTEVFRTVFGFHFAIVHDRKPEGVLPFEAVRGEATRALWLIKQDREVGRQLGALRARATIKVVR
jgi:peptidyl-prolyl cis-trans isomerase C